MKTFAIVLATTLSVFVLQPLDVFAQGLGSADASIEQGFSNFDSSLDSTASQMSQDYTSRQNDATNRYLNNAQANQDTENESERIFQDGQEQMIAGGGAYNSQGFMFGGGLGGMGGGFGGGMLGSGQMGQMASPSWSTGGAIRAPKYGSYNSVLSNYYGNVRPRARSRSIDSE
jgi:hypothetical protein